MRRIAAVVATCALALVLAPGALAAQAATPAPTTVTLVGVVRDTGGRTLSGAEVRAGPTQFAISGADGRFQVDSVPGDTVQLLVRRIGYRPADVILAATPGVRVELAVTLVPAAVELGTIVVEGRRMDTQLWSNGFYERQKLGRGTAFGPEVLERRGGTFGSLIREVPGVTVTRSRTGDLFASNQRGCGMLVFLDALHLRWADMVGLDELVNPNDLLAVEVYQRATQVPGSVGGLQGQGGMGIPNMVSGAAGAGSCEPGAILIWTKPFRNDDTP